MNKNQARSKFRILIERLGDLRAELDDLKCDLEYTAEEIEPYEGKDDLTAEQEERQEWFEESASTLEDLIDALNTASCDLEDRL